MRAWRFIVVLHRSRSILDKVSRTPPPQDLGRKADVEPLAVRHGGGVSNQVTKFGEGMSAMPAGAVRRTPPTASTAPGGS